MILVYKITDGVSILISWSHHNSLKNNRESPQHNDSYNDNGWRDTQWTIGSIDSYKSNLEQTLRCAAAQSAQCPAQPQNNLMAAHG